MRSRSYIGGFRSVGLYMLIGICYLQACDNERPEKVPIEKHDALIQHGREGMIYVDKISCDAVMQSSDSTGGAPAFYCYKVGLFVNNLPVTPSGKEDLETGKYYQYNMQYDWVALDNGDSLKPVFFQPKQRLEGHRNEAILVFESASKPPDTLIYNDSHGSWGTQQLIISSNKN